MRVLLIEDDETLTAAVAAGLAADGIQTDACGDGEEGLALLCGGVYDACCLDRMLPGLDGLAVLRRARAAGVATPVLLLTALARVGDRVDGLDAGADDYLAKPFDLRELAARLRALARRPAGFEPGRWIAAGCVTLYPNELRLEGPAGPVKVSKTECELLEMLLRSPGRLLARETLLARVWGAAAEVEDSSLDSYIYLVRRKLAKAGAGDAVRLATVRGAGYRLELAGC